MLNVGEVQPVTLAFDPPTFSMNIWCRVHAPAELNVALDKVERTAVAELLVIDLAARDGQVQEPVAQAGGRAQADHARDAGPVDGREGAPHQQVAPDRGQGIHGAAGGCARTRSPRCPYVVLISAMLFTVVPLTLVKFPPM